MNFPIEFVLKVKETALCKYKHTFIECRWKQDSLASDTSKQRFFHSCKNGWYVFFKAKVQKPVILIYKHTCQRTVAIKLWNIISPLYKYSFSAVKRKMKKRPKQYLE